MNKKGISSEIVITIGFVIVAVMVFLLLPKFGMPLLKKAPAYSALDLALSMDAVLAAPESIYYTSILQTGTRLFSESEYNVRFYFNYSILKSMVVIEGKCYPFFTDLNLKRDSKCEKTTMRVDIQKKDDSLLVFDSDKYCSTFSKQEEKKAKEELKIRGIGGKYV